MEIDALIEKHIQNQKDIIRASSIPISDTFELRKRFERKPVQLRRIWTIQECDERIEAKINK
jgi:hypothetical protein